MTLTIAAWNGSHDQLTQAAELYADAFSEAPYHEERSQSIESFTARVRRHASDKPSFRLLIATEGDGVVGLVLGTGASRGDWWWNRLEAALPAHVQEVWLDPECFSVEELAVDASHRRRGVAAALMTAVLDDLPYRTALLSCYQEAQSVHKLYTDLGWTVIDPAVHVTESRAVQVMGIRLHE